MKTSHAIMIVAASVGIALAVQRTMPVAAPQQAAFKESTFDRVMKTGVLRCGYYVFPPTTYRDPNTGALSGLSVDIMDKIASAAALKVQWTEEVNFGNWAIGLASGRFDAMCTAVWPNASLAREVSFTRPMLYAGINAYARGDDHRFDNNLAAINDPSVTIVVQEGEATDAIARAIFPKAKISTLATSAPAGSIAADVVAHKADVFLWDENGVYDFLKTNPGSVHGVDLAHPLRIMPFELAVSAGEYRLRDLLDVALQNLEDTGETDALTSKWERSPNSFYRASKPYRAP